MIEDLRVHYLNTACSSAFVISGPARLHVPARAADFDDRRPLYSSCPCGLPPAHRIPRGFGWNLGGKTRDVDTETNDDGDGDIDLNSAMANARANLAEGKSPGAGLDTAWSQADAAYADLIVTSVDSQGVSLDDEDVQDLAEGGMMDESSKSKKSKGLLGDMSDIFRALSGGAHIVKREDGSV